MKTLPGTILLLILLLSRQGQAQDLIVKKNSDIIVCCIQEIGKYDISYTLPDYPSTVSFSISKENVFKIVYENGISIGFKKASFLQPGDENLKKYAFKLKPLSPFLGYTNLSCERSIREGRSLEGTLGIVGLGFNTNSGNPAGIVLKAGYKFIRLPVSDIYTHKSVRLLEGLYLKPEISLGVIIMDINYWFYTWTMGDFRAIDDDYERRSVSSVYGSLVLGKQWIVFNNLVIDIYAGLGGGYSYFKKKKDVFYYTSKVSNYYYLQYGNMGSVIVSYGLKFGYLF